MFALTVALAAVASAGLVASTSKDLGPLAPLSLAGVWLLPGLMLIGALLALAIGDGVQAAAALALSSVVGATLYGLALAAPGFAVTQAQVTLINRGTTLGLGAFLLILVFGLIGMSVTLVVAVLLGRADM